jgi:predicted GIY-YIG superfamily endonuclease
MLLRDRLRARLAEEGQSPDYARIAAEVLGIRNAPPALAERLVAQAMVVEDRQEHWRATGERICADAPETPAVYVLVGEQDRAIYVGKANNLRRRLRAHFSARRWRALKAEFARASGARWTEVGSELEALLREAELIAELQPTVNVQTGPPDLDRRAVPAGLVRDVVVVLPSVEADSVELVAARPEGRWMIQRTRRDGSDLAVHGTRLFRFFNAVLERRQGQPPLAPIVYSWLAGRGESASRIDPATCESPQALRRQLLTLFADSQLFAERLVVLDSNPAAPRRRTPSRRSRTPTSSAE